MPRQTLASPVSKRWRGIIVLSLAALASGRTAKAQATWTTSGTNTYCITCNVGIGTSAPANRLQLAAGNIQIPSGNGAIDGNIFLGGNPVNFQSGLRIFGGLVNGSIDMGFIDVRTSVATNGLIFRVDTTQGGTERMRIAANGVVTISGDLTVTGNIAAKYQDLAEWVPSREKLAAGTVVVLDQTGPNRVVSSTKPYDTAVAGVVSQRPGLILGERGTDKALVATTGRVKVHADASTTPIRIGDLLVTSGKPGLAMRSEPVSVAGVPMHRPGTVIGKALENLPDGEGEILVLLSLQ
jgi:hypothetical protein